MNPGVLALLFGVGFIGGCANAIAGGATLITFPAMVASGLTPIIANASNSVAVMPGNIIAALSDRSKWPPMDRKFLSLLIVSVIGAVVGSWLLISNSNHTIEQVVPALIGIATILFALAPRLQALTARLRGTAHVPTAASRGVIGLNAVYGGYFGAGVGIMLMAILSIVETREMRELNATKNILAFSMALPAAIIFIVTGNVVWPQTIVMLVGASVGGFLGGRLIRVISPTAMRTVVATIGAVMTAIYVYRYWL